MTKAVDELAVERGIETKAVDQYAVERGTETKAGQQRGTDRPSGMHRSDTLCPSGMHRLITQRVLVTPVTIGRCWC